VTQTRHRLITVSCSLHVREVFKLETRHFAQRVYLCGTLNAIFGE